ncbi:MAG TPA: hypothetical protein VKJ47_23475 [Candidatus Binatia bacterium]|nr:hypothetical protein [Candidatus Binatia bacterium]
MLDGIKLEKAGVPAVAIVTAPFVATARAMAANWGVPSYEFLVTSHPIANLSEAELDTKADELAAQIVSFLEK